MNKFILLALTMFIPSVCWGEDAHWVDENGNEVSDEKVADFMNDSFTDMIKQQAQENLPIFEKLTTCSPAQGQYMQVIGQENNLCHFKFVDYDCLFPQEIAKEYAELGIKASQEMLKGKFSTETPENTRMNEILSNEDYCSYKMTWTVTMEDEDGNEVPVEGVIIE